jgi:hypothetical protein
MVWICRYHNHVYIWIRVDIPYVDYSRVSIHMVVYTYTVQKSTVSTPFYSTQYCYSWKVEVRVLREIWMLDGFEVIMMSDAIAALELLQYRL